MQHIVIIGNGISGISVATNIRKKSNDKITIISDESKYFFSRTALMYVYMGHMPFENTQPYENDFWKKNNLDLLYQKVIRIDKNQKEIYLQDNVVIAYDKLVIASGSKPNLFDWPGQNSIGVTSLYHKRDLEKLEKLSKNATSAVVVGGGLIGIELVEMLHSRNIHVTFLIREENFWGSVLPKEDAKLINNHILEHAINLKTFTNLKEIVSDENGHVTGVITDHEEFIPCQIVGLTIGVSPNIEFLKDSGIATGRGVKVDKYLQTNVEDVYAIGDCAEQCDPHEYRKPIEAVWYTGKIMGETLAKTITGIKTEYNPGNWFNSAKFFDIEYQTYGWVFANPLPDEKQIFWQHRKGKKAIRISYNKTDFTFLGINTFGIRMRQDFFEEVQNQKKTVQYVIENLHKANFDPEFFSNHQKEIFEILSKQIK
jgi:NAD(P)H-nitrite reductase large subunit